MKHFLINISLAVAISNLLLVSCTKDTTPPAPNTITIQNVLDARALVESGSFKGEGTPPVIFPGQSVSFSFYAGPTQRLSFATMYGWSNDLFFAPANPGIQLYTDDGKPITGDVSSSIRLWDNGTRINQKPGADVMHPGVAEPTAKPIAEVAGTDAQGNTYLPASKLMQVMLAYDGNARFTITLANISNGTANETPFSPGVWAISYALGGSLLLPEPIYAMGQPSANGLTNIAESGDVTPMLKYVTDNTGIFTPLSPVLVVVYRGGVNPFFKVGEEDRGQGLKEIAQMGNADKLAEFLKTEKNVKEVYVLKEPKTTVLLPRINGIDGGMVSQQLNIKPGDKIALATMYGFSKDWFFATKRNDIEAVRKGDLSSLVGLYDNGTKLDLFPGASGAAPDEHKPIQAVPNPNQYTELPDIREMIKVTLY